MPEPSIAPFVGYVGTPDNGHRTSFTAVELMGTDFPEPRFAVPGILAEGLNFMVGAPKLGKSFLMLNVAIAVASGGQALGQIGVEPGEVLFLALEDSPRRLKGRLQKLLGGNTAPNGLHFHTDWPRLNQGGDEQITAWLEDHPGCRLAVVDIFSKVRPRVSDKSDRFLADYDAAQLLKAVADLRGLAVVALHHTRKASADDFVETISGTHGLAAAADTIIVAKRSRGQADATLQITGRDVEEQELALRFDPAVCSWCLLGDAAEYATSETRRQIIEAIREADQALRPKQIAEEAEANYDVVKHLVRRMVDDDQLITDGKGFYSLPLHSIHHVHRSFTDDVHPSPPDSEQSEQSERLAEEDQEPEVNEW